ncbi:Ribosomal RNA large subunit methyltransferase E [Zostera marina]|uniref:rRNA methyltransferase 2, mitochondrial n=1 Tax=Zostera marina TaxID=29655 RepID=A0A0K9P5V4_ZOSMR|nr:Ribosomal RNA large subunit methyltransferase E [Zostera marina]
MSVSGTVDFFYKEALRLGYVARSAFKLLQIQKQHNLILPGASVLDLGCAPGAWLQVACQHLGPLEKGGSVVGVDVKKVKVPSAYCDARVRTISTNVLSLLRDQARNLSPEGKGFSVVLSDMCPSISGITTKDAALSFELGCQAFSLAIGKIDYLGEYDVPMYDDNGSGILRTGGNLVVKFLESEDAQGFGKSCKSNFSKVSWLRPKATRSSSREIYLICQGLRRSKF